MKIRIDDIPQNISIKEIVLDIQVNDNSLKVQSSFSNNEDIVNSANASNTVNVAKIVSKSSSVSDIKDEIQNIDLKASAEIPEEMNEQF